MSFLIPVIKQKDDEIARLKAEIADLKHDLERHIQIATDAFNGVAQAVAIPLPDRERMAEILYTAAHKGLSNCWKWSDADLDHEHPASRGYWYKIADGTLSALSSTNCAAPPSVALEAKPRCPATRQVFEIVLTSLNYDGQDIDSLTVGEIRRALP